MNANSNTPANPQGSSTETKHTPSDNSCDCGAQDCAEHRPHSDNCAVYRETKHTPTPRFSVSAFYSNESKTNHPSGWEVTDKADGSSVASFDSIEDAQDECKALNRALENNFIFRACNEHAALCAVAEAAKRIQSHRAKLKDQSFKPNEMFFAKLTDLENELESAIKNYEG